MFEAREQHLSARCVAIGTHPQTGTLKPDQVLISWRPPRTNAATRIDTPIADKNLRTFLRKQQLLDRGRNVAKAVIRFGERATLLQTLFNAA